MRAAVALSLIALLAAGCKRQDMYTQGKSKTWDASDFLPKGRTMQRPVEGTVARDAPDPPMPQPRVIDAALVARGQQRFEIFCTPCHGRTGDGEGMIVQRGFPPPPSFHSDDLRSAKASHFYDVITNGYGVMYPFAERVPPADRWAIAAYIRALQDSRHAAVASLSAADRASLPPPGAAP